MSRSSLWHRKNACRISWTTLERLSFTLWLCLMRQEHQIPFQSVWKSAHNHIQRIVWLSVCLKTNQIWSRCTNLQKECNLELKWQKDAPELLIWGLNGKQDFHGNIGKFLIQMIKSSTSQETWFKTFLVSWGSICQRLCSTQLKMWNISRQKISNCLFHQLICYPRFTANKSRI